MRRYLLGVTGLVVMLGLLQSHPAAQLAANDVYVNAPFQVAATHPGTDATGWRLYRNGVLVATVTRAQGWVAATSTVTFPQRTETTVGSVTYTMSTINSDGTTTHESPAPFPSVVVNVRPALAVPTNPTLLRTIRVS